MIGIDAPYITTDEEADRLFGKGSEMGRMTKISVCFKSGHRNKSDACPVCSRRRQEKQRADWFAAEERAGR